MQKKAKRRSRDDLRFPVKLLFECFDYQRSTGRLFWKHRPLDHFIDEHYQKIGNWHAGHEAFTAISNKNRGGLAITVVRFSGVKFSLTRPQVVWAMHTGEWSTLPISHKSQSVLDDRFDNLVVFNAIDRTNRHKAPPSTILGYGIRKTRSGRFDVRLTYDQVSFYLGRFDTLEQAVAAKKAKYAEVRAEK